MTATIAKAMQDTSLSIVAAEVCYITPREMSDEGMYGIVLGAYAGR